MIKVKIVTLETDSCYECGGTQVLHPMTTDWEEIPEKDISKLREAVFQTNRTSSERGYRLIIVYYEENTISHAYHLASDFLKAQEDMEKAAMIKREKDSEARLKIAHDRKMKQFAKLQRELGITE